MEEPEEFQIQSMGKQAQDAKEENPTKYMDLSKSRITVYTSYNQWLCVAIYMLFVLFSQSATIILVRLYYSEGRTSKWMVALTQLTGFPVLIPYYGICNQKVFNTDNFHRKLPLNSLLASIYNLYGIFPAAHTMMYSAGVLYLPIHTFLFLCAFQMTFTAFFSSYLHLQRFKSSKIVSHFSLHLLHPPCIWIPLCKTSKSA